jgi:hypothetical protein
MTLHHQPDRPIVSYCLVQRNNLLMS